MISLTRPGNHSPKKLYGKIMKDPAMLFDWVNQRFRLGHGFNMFQVRFLYVYQAGLSHIPSSSP